METYETAEGAVPAEELLPSPARQPEEIVMLRETIDEVLADVEQMDDKNQHIFHLCIEEERTESEAARFLRLPQGTVSRRLSKMRGRFRARFGAPD